MKITILNGSSTPGAFDTYLAQLHSALAASGHAVTQIDLRDIPLRYCVGCFGCWVKTPGQCVSRDASLAMDRAVIQSDFTLWAAPLKMGFPDVLLKMALDKHLPLIMPYIDVVNHEAHHQRRYPRSPRVGLLVAPEPGTDARDLQIVTDIFTRTALNFRSCLEFSLTTATSAADLAERFASVHPVRLPLPARLPAATGVAIAPPSRLVVFNGSPRGRRGNTPLMLEQFAAGFARPVETYHLVRLHETEDMLQAFANAECVLLGFPLYTDAMPGVVKRFIEALAPLVDRPANPPLAFLVQSGFPEASHSRYVERYLEKLAARLHSPYLGAIVKGGGEGVRSMPPEMNRALFANLSALGAGLAATGRLDPALLRAFARPEHYPAILGPLFQIFLRLPLARAYFDGQMKQNGAYERRFARPFEA